jgi:hypothetical protein
VSRTRGGSGRQRTARAGGERRWGLIIGVVAVVAILGGFIALVVVDVGQRAAQKPPEGVESFEIESREHTEGDISYEQNPPVGGKHNPIWQNCGFYSEPVRNENAVHSLEHGAAWITYRPDLPQQQVDKLREVASDNDFVLVSPYPDLPSPVVASAWGKQLRLDSAEDPRLERFISAYQRGPQTPEPGAPCTGGVGEPEA